ncbi:hypothetical protein BN2537_15255 [Streptomyces venezuelae]|nr:hypothetical protein BN2537_15255 [Streptomyces venezuelae]
MGHAEQGCRDDARALPSDRSTEDNCPCRYARWHVAPPRRTSEWLGKPTLTCRALTGRAPSVSLT